MRFIDKHPLASQNRSLAIANWFKWQVSSRILKMPVIFPWIRDSKLVVESSMTGATGNIYAGLHEFTDMAFCLHLLRAGDLFVDVGANIGSYTVLASKVSGANSLSLEPVPTTFKHLTRNININELSQLVEARCCAVGKASGSIQFSTDCDTTNQVVDSTYTGVSIEVPVMSLDEILKTSKPTLIKIDVEGYEPEVIQGAINTLSCSSILAILLETVNPEIEVTLQNNGFSNASYDPFTRTLTTSSINNHRGNNYLWIKNPDQIIDRCRKSDKYEALGIYF
ncbi:FkbM family methyltransferase [Pseudanabaena biceps]|nr:FkbM family methyltransferase [Pseudanabaena biceps]